MSDTIIEESIRDTNTYSATNDSGAIASTQLFHIVNDLDAEATVTFYGTRQEDATSFADEVELGSVTVTASTTSFETLSDPWEEVKVKIVASSTPSSGDIGVYEMN